MLKYVLFCNEFELYSPRTPVIENPVLIIQTQEEPNTDALQPEDHEEKPDAGQKQLTHHPDK